MKIKRYSSQETTYYLLFDITSDILYWRGMGALEEHLKSLDKIY